MRRTWGPVALGLIAATVLGADDRSDLPDDLARVPAKAQVAVSFRVATLWDGELGKELRKALGDDVNHLTEGPLSRLRLSPAEVERVTIGFTSFNQLEEGFLILTRTTKKLDARAASAVLPDGAEETIDEQKVVVSRGTGAFVGPDGKTFVLGSMAILRPHLTGKAGKPTGDLAAMLAKADKHHVAAYLDPSALAVKGEFMPPVPAPFRSLVAAKSAVLYADVDHTTKVTARATFADEKAAGKGRKALDAGRTLASLTLSGAGEAIAGGSKPIAALLSRVEKALDDGVIEQKGADVSAAFQLTVGKAAVGPLFKEVAVKVAAAAARTRATNNLKQIAIALHNYHDTNGSLPPAASYDTDGKALLSWRVHILPYIEQNELYKEFKLDEPWDSPHNKKLLPKMPKVYASPRGKAAEGGTFYQAFHGKGAAFEGKRGLKFAQFPDGLSNTLMVVEASKDVPWTKPEDVPFDPDGKLPKLGGIWDGGFLVLFCDGSVRFLKATIKPETLKLMIIRNDGQPIPFDD